MISKIRVKEYDDKEVFVNANDLIIELLLKLDKAHSEVEKHSIRCFIARITELRDTAHKH